MKTILMLGVIVLSFFAAPPAAAQGPCAECRRTSLDELTRCQALARSAPERTSCDRNFADMNRICAGGVCAQELESRTVSRCLDCKSTASAEAERCRSLPVGSEAQVACAQRSGDMLAGCEARFCRSP
jgi:hypothetical protein